MSRQANLFTKAKCSTFEAGFVQFLESLIPQVERKSKQLNLAHWILETTGSSDAATLKAALDEEYRLLFHGKAPYQQLLTWEKEGSLTDPLLKRQLNVLLRTFKQNQLPKELLEEIAQKEAALAESYATFRPEKNLTENEIREILKEERDPAVRRAVWESSKEIGTFLAPQILELVFLRNRAAEHFGYNDYFQMELDLQEVDGKWLLETLEALWKGSEGAYGAVVEEIETALSERFCIAHELLGPWAWSDPFAQEDPLGAEELDQLVAGVDIAQAATEFYRRMGFDVAPILAESDMEERAGKNQHAFCIHIDRSGDIRTLNNVKPSIRWLETVLHELGHAIYELGLDAHLPWLLREPPHMVPTEAMALLAGRQAYREASLPALVGSGNETLFSIAEKSLKRRQLLFSRWVAVMTVFESELYRDPSQDLNALWWHCVQKYQKICPSQGREGKGDWAAKYHIGFAPVYYFSYLLGEMFASSIQEALLKQTGSTSLDRPEAGHFLQERLFAPGNRMSWDALVCHVTKEPLTPAAWLREFGSP